MTWCASVHGAWENEVVTHFRISRSRLINILCHQCQFPKKLAVGPLIRRAGRAAPGSHSRYTPFLNRSWQGWIIAWLLEAFEFQRVPRAGTRHICVGWRRKGKRCGDLPESAASNLLVSTPERIHESFRVTPSENLMSRSRWAPCSHGIG